MERRLLPAEHAVLAMLREGPMHGYEMARLFESPELQLICPVEQSSLYTYLRNLEAPGFVTWSERRVGARPPRKMYELTEVGRAEVERWLRTAVERLREVRMDFLLKLFFLRQFDREAELQLIQDQIDVCERYLQSLDAVEVVSEFHMLALDSKRSAAVGTLNWLRTYIQQAMLEATK
ncbi:MAG: PadR family transcriptional regulator [Dehalococcoidia bacterium]|nr:PadR family transcriptional regulator [Dehalococcoidia bacterium]